ncbi:restriction endonuclease subunit S [Tenebrionicola larvae]|uniref:Restriction endonuclease subunit S n=1 Tax=Tenebrionicola larvae TaxID=2815733 RepID=A0A949Q3X4_9ENTR|nr:restriction endonuclease subunit S [Tenebrionicola larvae]MBV5095382.1 restriction endonuclease subunit S [Tenebrionicola larvae]
MMPKLRFSEFNMPWKQTTLGSVSSHAAYGMNSSAIEFDGVNKYIRITDIDDDTREFTPSPLTTPSGKLENKYLLNKGDIVFARTGASVGKSYLYKQKDGRLYFAGFLIKLTINKANPYFVYNQTLTEKYRKWVKTYSMRSGQPGINAEEYKEFEFAIPSLEEQTKIADFLSSVDEKISLLNQQYDLLCQYKKA